MAKNIRIGMVGAGFIAGYHYDCIKRVHAVNANVLGVFDIIPEKRKSFASAHGITEFTSLEKMLGEVDIIDICTPPYAHKQNIVEAAKAGKHIICEKPLIGYSPPDEETDAFQGNVFPKKLMLEKIRDSLGEICGAVTGSGVIFGYAENFVYAPSIQKEREIITRSGAQILRMLGEESHSGNHAPYSSFWKFACGGSIISTGAHPLAALLYLKRAEGEAAGAGPVRPVSVSARTHELTKIPNYRDKGFIRTGYHDVEDYGWIHVTFEDGTVGDVVTSATVLGGIYDYVEVFANNHRSRCRINPVNLLDTYNPGGESFKDIYLVEKASTKEGWSNAAPDEYWTVGYQAEMQDFLECIVTGRKPQSGLDLAVDTAVLIHSAYLSAERNGSEVKIEGRG